MFRPVKLIEDKGDEGEIVRGYRVFLRLRAIKKIENPIMTKETETINSKNIFKPP
jgi:hypothetical protein